MKRYIGITIGPIVETITETSKPAGLWFASSLFSDITRRLCLEITNSSLDASVLSPYFDESETSHDGVGKYHDRIIVSTETELDIKAVLEEIIQKVKRETIFSFLPHMKEEKKMEKTLGDKKEEIEFLMQYLQINYVIMEEDQLTQANSILAISPYLDAIELLKTVPLNQEASPFQKIFHDSRVASDSRSMNDPIKECSLFKDIDQESNQFFSEKNGRKIRDLEEISMGNSVENEAYKKTKYFATVSADGDGMGKFLKSLSSDTDVRKFSKACLEYDKQAAQMIGEFGGMTIYAGGDDLVFLAPLECARQDKTIFALCAEINQAFRRIVREIFEAEGNSTAEEALKNIPTISFGIAVHYYKYPLYQALANARTLLYYIKQPPKIKVVDDSGKELEKEGEKNAIAVNIEKHSGQSVGLFIPHDSVQVVNQLLKIQTDGKLQGAAEVERVQSVIYTLENMKSLIEVLDQQNLDGKQYWNSWKNFFDNSDQEKAQKYHETLCNIYYEKFSKNQSRIRSMKDVQERKLNDVDTLEAFTMLLRLEKFLKEKGDRE